MRAFPEAFIGLTETGWMKGSAFVAWLAEFDRFVEWLSIERPVVLFIDGHASHITIDAARFCRDHGIIYHLLVINASFVLQPFDVGIYSELKTNWRKAVSLWAVTNLNSNVDKRTFPAIFKTAWQGIMQASYAVRAFKHAGIFLFNVKAVEYGRLVLGPQVPQEAICQPAIVQPTAELLPIDQSAAPALPTVDANDSDLAVPLRDLFNEDNISAPNVDAISKCN